MTGHEPMKVTRFVDGQPFELSQEDIERRITDDELRMELRRSWRTCGPSGLLISSRMLCKMLIS